MDDDDDDDDATLCTRQELTPRGSTSRGVCGLAACRIGRAPVGVRVDEGFSQIH